MFGFGKKVNDDSYDKNGHWRVKPLLISVTPTVLNENIRYEFRREISIVGIYGRTGTDVGIWFDDADNFTNYSLPTSLPFEVQSVTYTPANYSTFTNGNYILINAGIYITFDTEPIRTRQIFFRPPSLANCAVSVYFI
jgi:hypothetical protein